MRGSRKTIGIICFLAVLITVMTFSNPSFVMAEEPTDLLMEEVVDPTEPEDCMPETEEQRFDSDVLEAIPEEAAPETAESSGQEEEAAPETAENSGQEEEASDTPPEDVILQPETEKEEVIPQYYESNDAPSNSAASLQEKKKTDLSDIAVITLSKSAYTYKAKEIKPKPTVTIETDTGPIVLKAKKDYKISYKNNINAGIATVTIKGRGNFTGTVKETFRIKPAPLTSARLKFTVKTHTGKPITQTRTTKVYGKVGGRKLLLAHKKDYKISYENNINVGIATMTIKGRGNFTGTIKETFRITAYWESQKTTIGSLYPEQYKRLVNNQKMNPQDPTGTVFTEFASMIKDSTVIPGILRTHIIRENGTHTTCEDMIVQGLCMADGYMILSAYCNDMLHPSVLYIIRDGQYLETINLRRPDGAPFYNHVGGLTYLNGNIYIAGGDEYCVFSLPLSDIVSTLGKQDAVTLQLGIAFFTQKVASFLTAYGKKIYVGTFYMNEYLEPTYNTTMRAYDPVSGAASGKEYTLPANNIQGAAIIRKNGTTFLLLSASWGRANTSRLMSVKLGGSSNLSVYRSVTIPNMSENLAYANGRLYVNFESAARKYTTGAYQHLIRPLDRVIALHYRKLIK